METEKFKIDGDYIELIQLLKAVGIAGTGGHAKYLVDEGLILRNDAVELRRRAKLIPGDVIVIEDQRIELE